MTVNAVDLDYIIMIILIIHGFCCYLSGYFLRFVILLFSYFSYILLFSTALFLLVSKSCREIGCLEENH